MSATPSSPAKRPVRLAAHFPGVNNLTVWTDPESGSQIAPESFAHLARTAERGCFDYFFLAEGLRLREHRDAIHDLDVVGRPDALTILGLVAAVTEHLGLGATISATFNEPYELARKLASLDHLSGGRTGWNLVTSSDAFTGANFRRGGFLRYRDRYVRAREFLAVCDQVWSGTGFDFTGEQFDVRGAAPLPPSPQGRPVIIQAGDSDDGRDFGASIADVIFSRHSTLAAGQAFYADVKAKAATHGRDPEQLLIMPGVTFSLGDTDEEAAELAAVVRRQQISGPTAIVLLEQVWRRDLSAYDPDGPLPDIDPDVDGDVSKGRVQFTKDPMAVAAKWRSIAEAKGLSIRDLMIKVQGRQSFIGSAATIAAQLDDHVQQRGSDGFIVVPHLVPTGLDRFVDEVVPLLQERGVLRSSYDTSTLRGHLGLDPASSAPRSAPSSAP